MFPEPTPFSGKRLVPRLAVGCVVFAIVGLLGTILMGRVLTPLFKGDRDALAREAAAREAGGR